MRWHICCPEGTFIHSTWCHLTNAFKGARRQLNACLRQIQTWSASNLCLQTTWIATYVSSLYPFVSEHVTLAVESLYAIHILAHVHARLCFAWRFYKMFSETSTQLSRSHVYIRQTGSLFKLCDKEK
jgi:hypothetical protein